MNIFSHYIPNKSITIDKDPAQINQYIKRKIMDKTLACKSFNTNNKNYDAYLKLHTISAELSEMILQRKDDHYCHLSDKLNDPKKNAEA